MQQRYQRRSKQYHIASLARLIHLMTYCTAIFEIFVLDNNWNTSTLGNACFLFKPFLIRIPVPPVQLFSMVSNKITGTTSRKTTEHLKRAGSVTNSVLSILHFYNNSTGGSEQCFTKIVSAVAKAIAFFLEHVRYYLQDIYNLPLRNITHICNSNITIKDTLFFQFRPYL